MRRRVVLFSAWLAGTALAAAAVPARAEDHPRMVNEAEPASPTGAVPGLGSDQLRAPTPDASRLRKWGSLGGVAGVYGAATTYMYFAWYHGQPVLQAFKIGGDGYFGRGTYAGGSDKLGHAWSNLMMSRATTEVLAWGGWERWKAGLIASGMTLALFTVFEVKDGFYTEFSPGDEVFNALGAALNVAMVAYPPLDDAFDFRVEYFPSREYLGLLRGARPTPDPTRPHQVSLNFVEDYSGQRYLLALHAHALPFLRGRSWARVLDVAVGYETHGYKPEPVDPGARRDQHLFLGISVNMQGVLELALGDRSGTVATPARALGHFVFEFVNPLYCSAALVGSTHSSP